MAISAVVFSYFNLVTTSHASNAPVEVGVVPEGTSILIGLRDPNIKSAVVPMNVDQIVETHLAKNAASAAMARALSAPAAVRYLIGDRPDPDYLAALEVDSPEWRLLNYVVLQYSDSKSAQRALSQLKASRLFRALDRDGTVEFSFTPSDTYFAPAGHTSPLNKQWGMVALNLPIAWNAQKGYDYIGIVDNGIQRGHPDLSEDRSGNVRAHFSGSWHTLSPIQSNANFDESYQVFALGHGSHVAGIVAATTNNVTGVSGVCQTCGVAIAKASDGALGLTRANIAMSIYGMTKTGVQAINLSFGSATGRCEDDTQPVLPAYCDALSFARQRDVVVVAAAGNHKMPLRFPANQAGVFSVGGYQADASTWDQMLPLPDSPARVFGSTTETGTNFGSNQLVVAPARDILSTFYTNAQWINRCGSVSSFNTALPNDQFAGPVVQSVHAAASGNQYGICTGTSMAAPHFTGLVGLIRSTNPLLTTAEVRAKLQLAAGGVFISDTWGYGLPDSAVAVTNSLPAQRLTPLFAFYNSTQNDYVYTVFPQMGASLLSGQVPPFVGSLSSTGPYFTYSWIGNPVALFPVTFLGVTIAIKPGQSSIDNYKPRARLRVFTTQADANNVTLWPICRFSYVTAGVVRHIMDTAPSCAQSTLPPFAVLDGHEGYVYPPTSPQPVGTTGVIRMEKVPAGGGPSVFVFTAATDQSYYASQGFFNPVTLGYAYLN